MLYGWSNVAAHNPLSVALHPEWLPAPVNQVVDDRPGTFRLAGVRVELQPRGLEGGVSEDSTIQGFDDHVAATVRTFHDQFFHLKFYASFF